MTGLSDYASKNLLNNITGQIPQPTLPAAYLALFTAVGTDAGTGFTEVSGGAYARVQVSGALALSASFTTSSTTLTLGSTAPAWLLALGTSGSGVSVYDTTNSQLIGTVSSITGTTVTLAAAALHASSGSTDSLTFSAFSNASGSAPSSITNGAAVTFPAATASWNTVIAFGLYDASTSGNLQVWDFLGNFSWLPFESTSVNTGNGPVFSVKGNGYSSNDPIVATAEYGGTLPTLTTGTLTGYTVWFAANVATDSITACTTSGPTTAFAATSTGSGMLRKIVQQSIPSGVTASFAAAALAASAA